MASKQPKPALLREVMRKHEELTVVYIDDKRQRRMMMTIRGAMVRLRIEMGRWMNEQAAYLQALEGKWKSWSTSFYTVKIPPGGE